MRGQHVLGEAHQRDRPQVGQAVVGQVAGTRLWLTAKLFATVTKV